MLNVLNTKPDIAEILVTPILVDIFASTYNSLIADPTNIIDVYEQLFQALSSSHDRFKTLFERVSLSGLNNKDLQKIFWAASFFLFKKRKDITFREPELIQAFDDAAKKLGFNAANMHIDVIDKTSLINRDGLEFSYLHKSIIEFYTAKHVQQLPDNTRSNFYKFIYEYNNVDYANVLTYLSKIDSELLNIELMSPFVELLKEETNIYKFERFENISLVKDASIVKEIIKELLATTQGDLSLKIVLFDNKGDISVEYFYDANYINNKYYLISFILGYDDLFYEINHEIITISMENIFKDRVKLKALLENKVISIFETEDVFHYSADLNDLIDNDIVNWNIIGEEYFMNTFDFFYEVDSLVNQSKKIYSQYSDLDLF